MPIFEYKCDDCGEKFEKLVRGGDQVQCPQCGESHLTTQFSTFAARANGAASDAPMGGCASGMCRTPDICGRN
jgi:putative FmdB family regulatory protein